MAFDDENLLRPTPQYYGVRGRANEIARFAGGARPGPEHWLLAILHEPLTVPTWALGRLIDLDQAEAALAAVVNAAGYSPPDAAVPGQATEVQVRAAQIATALGHSHIGAEHLFLAIVRDRECTATRALARTVDPGQAEAAVTDVMNSPEYRGEPCARASRRVYLPRGEQLDAPLRMAMVDSTPEGATFGFNWDSDGRPWIHVTEQQDNGRALLNDALASLGRPQVD